MRAAKFELFMGCLGNGITVCNKAVMECGDFKHIAHISEEGIITWYVSDDYCPPEARKRIEQEAGRQGEKYQQWFNSLPKLEQYDIQLSKMSPTELVEHLRQKMGDSGNKY